MRMKIKYAITSARRTLPVCFDRHAGRSHLLEEVVLLVWLETRAKLEKSTVELDITRTVAKTLAIQLKLSRYAEEDKHCTHLMLS